jgi:hypothetical protein
MSKARIQNIQKVCNNFPMAYNFIYQRYCIDKKQGVKL